MTCKPNAEILSTVGRIRMKWQATGIGTTTYVRGEFSRETCDATELLK
jgi:hypothetical protein